MLLVMTAVTVLISLTVHEIAHGWVAYKMGDPTAKNLGRLTLDPRKHLDPIGTIMMLFIGVGYAKPVPVNSRYFKKPKLGMALTAAAGPAVNILMSFFATALYLLFFRLYAGAFTAGQSSFAVNCLYYLYVFFYYFHMLNLSLAIFNLLPIPPFDGSRIAFIFLPERLYFAVMKYERYILLGVLVLMWSGASFNVISTVAGFFSDLFIKFWSLIPFLG
jgi:Zn-dependent protease